MAPERVEDSGDAYHAGAQVWVPVMEGSGKEKGSTGDLLYSARKKVKRWVPGSVREVNVVVDDPNSPQLTVETEEGETMQGLHITDCPLRNDRDDTVDDLVKSDFLHEPGILHTLRVRYSLDMIYTYSANILIASNPHKRLRTMYGPRMMGQYKGSQLGELSPHVYSIAEQAFNYMMMDEQKQAILISGESGAGKTESAKQVMQYLANRGTAPRKASDLSSPRASFAMARGLNPRMSFDGSGDGEQKGGGSAPIEEQVLESNPLLEAFGNAKTSRNDNSSRFGKFVEMFFDLFGRVTGASINTYLLERSRVVSIQSPERSYHIFYQLIAGADPELRKQLKLGNNPREFQYLSTSDVFELNNVDDAEEFRRTLDAMHIIGLSEVDIDAVLRAVAAVLHLGNVQFVQQDFDTAQFDAKGQAELETVADLLGVDKDGLQKALLTRTIETVGEKITKNLDAGAAGEARDALAKNIYAKLFDWLVSAINRKIMAVGTGKRTSRSIGILDIYGFESFKENSFEQLCINLANERLQQQFNGHVFKGEQEEYEREGIDWSYVEFIDNQDCLDLLEGVPGKHGMGVFPLIDEACRMPRATYEGLAHTVRTKLEERPRFSAPKRPQHCFVVDHYAGKVCYSAEALLEKNKDFVVAEHAALLYGSTNPVIQNMFAPVDPTDPASPRADMDGSDAAPRPGRREVRSSFKFVSVGLQFRKQLAGLMSTLNECHPHYIRCIKPNPDSKPGNLVPEYVLEQLRAGGVLEAVRIATAGFPTRKEFMPFAQRYALLISGGRYEPRDWEAADPEEVVGACKKALQSVRLQGWQIGRSRVFLRAGQLAQLEGARGRKVAQSAITIQAAWRQHLVRAWFKRQIELLTKVQALWRGTKGRQVAQGMREERAATTIQAGYRMHRERSKFVAWRRTRAAIKIQAYVRMVRQREHFRRETEAGRKAAERDALRRQQATAATAIQSRWRCVLAKRKLEALRAEAQKWKVLEGERDHWREEAIMWKQRCGAAERRCAEMDAQIVRLGTELEAVRLEGRAAADAAAAQAAAAANVAAKSAIMAELALLRRQKEEGESAMEALQDQVREVSSAFKAKSGELEALMVAQKEKDEQSRQLLEQTRATLEEYESEFGSKDAEIAALKEEVGAAREMALEQVAAIKASVEAERNAFMEEAAARVSRMEEELRDKDEALAAAQERNVHFSSRLVALNAQKAKLEKVAAEKDVIIRSQVEEAEGLMARAAAASRDLTPAEAAEANGVEEAAPLPQEQEAAPRIADGAAVLVPGGALAMPGGYGEGPSSPPPGEVEGMPGAFAISEYAGLSREHEETLQGLVFGAVAKRLQIVNVQHGPTPADAIGMPVSAWIMGECLLKWATRWTHTEMDIVAIRIKTAVLGNSTDLQLQAYWLSASLALGAFLRVRSIGKRDVGNLFKFGDDMIHFTPLHQLLAESIADIIPVDVNTLLGSSARKTRAARSPPAVGGGKGGRHGGERDVESLMSSPWKGLLGGLGNVMEALRGEGLPGSAVRAVVAATLSYVNAELLNALLLRRDCCSISSVKALQNGLGDLKAWFGFMGCGDPADVDRSLEHVNQAVKYLLIGKDDCVRKAAKGFDVLADLKRMCPKLTLQQVYKLTEHHHDDWIAGFGGGSGNLTIILLELLKRHMEERGEGLAVPGSPASSTSGGGGGSTPSMAGQASGPSQGRADEEDGLLLDPLAQFVLPRRLLTEAARQFVQAPRSGGHGPGISLLERIEKSCRATPLPRQLRNNPDFEFLQQQQQQ